MIEVTIAPDRIEAGMPAVIEVCLKNAGPGRCTTVVFTMRLPAGLVLLEGEDRIERSVIAPGDSFVSRIRLRAREPGRYELTSRSFSYKDQRGIPRHVTGFAAAISAAPRQPQRPPKVTVDALNSELPNESWDMLRRRVTNAGKTVYGTTPDEDSWAAFLSYAGDDDVDGRVSLLREHLSEEVGRYIGGKFPIFQDRTDIHWGQQWRRRIENTLNVVTFLIPVVTPRFFASTFCRHEVESYLTRESNLRRDDLILPIYYIDCVQLHGADESTDSLVSVIAAHQYMDWRRLRLLPMTSTTVRRGLAQMAEKIRMAMQRGRDGSSP